MKRKYKLNAVLDKIGQYPFKPWYFSGEDFPNSFYSNLAYQGFKLALELEERFDIGQVKVNSGFPSAWGLYYSTSRKGTEWRDLISCLCPSFTFYGFSSLRVDK